MVFAAQPAESGVGCMTPNLSQIGDAFATRSEELPPLANQQFDVSFTLFKELISLRLF